MDQEGYVNYVAYVSTVSLSIRNIPLTPSQTLLDRVLCSPKPTVASLIPISRFVICILGC